MDPTRKGFDPEFLFAFRRGEPKFLSSSINCCFSFSNLLGMTAVRFSSVILLFYLATILDRGNLSICSSTIMVKSQFIQR